MTFFLKKKLVRDRLAGLSFRWRSGTRRQSLGTVIALLITLLVGVTLFYGVKISLPEARQFQNGEVAVVTVISPEHPQVRSRAQFSSPFLDRWDPAFDDEVNTRIQAISRSSLLKSNYVEKQLLKAPMRRFQVAYPTVAGRVNSLPKLEAPEVKKVPVTGMCKLELSGSNKALSKRVPVKLPDFPNGLDWGKRGSSYGFIISISGSGRVLYCSPIGMNHLDGLESWLRGVKFKESKSDSLTAKITIHVKEVMP